MAAVSTAAIFLAWALGNSTIQAGIIIGLLFTGGTYMVLYSHLGPLGRGRLTKVLGKVPWLIDIPIWSLTALSAIFLPVNIALGMAFFSLLTTVLLRVAASKKTT